MNIKTIFQTIQNTFKPQEKLQDEVVIKFLLVLENARAEELSCGEMYARLDEFVIIPQVSPVAVTKALLEAVEVAARELQTEVGFVFMSHSAPAALVQPFLDQGYERVVIDALRIPAWREAVAEMHSDKQILMKKLRDSLVLTPL